MFGTEVQEDDNQLRFDLDRGVVRHYHILESLQLSKNANILISQKLLESLIKVHH